VRPTVLLFDIDGTLVTAAGVGRRALERAIAARYGTTAVLDGVRFDGTTDRAIVRLALAALGEAVEGPPVMDEILADDVPFPPLPRPRPRRGRRHAPLSRAESRRRSA
jgi:beta-phosphoglucomutase-like phosphatase (HAD superfamily)